MQVFDELYPQLAQARVVTLQDVTQITEKLLGRPLNAGYVYRKYVYSLQRRGYIHRIRRNLYVVKQPGQTQPTADRYLIASKLRGNYYLGYHTALEFHGTAYSLWNTVYVCVHPRDRFDEFSHLNQTFRPVLVEDTETDIETRSHLDHTVRVCGKERLFIECLDHPEYAGGWEESLKSLQSLPGLDFNHLTELTLKKNKQVLTRKVGWVLEKLRDESVYYQHLTDEPISRLTAHLIPQNMYLQRGAPGELNQKWQLYIPPRVEEATRGI
jgi:predicted transcriptional regulator of viral defense system